MTGTGTFASASFMFAACLLALAGLRCDLGNALGPHERGPALEILYSSSFEANADTSGWEVHSAVGFAGEAAPQGGQRSLRVSGGCIVPHGLVYVRQPFHGGKLQLRLWGKNILNGGGVTLGRGNPAVYARDRVGISVTDSVWTAYTSDLLPCTAGDTIWIAFMCGGIVPGVMLVDKVEVVRVSG